MENGQRQDESRGLTRRAFLNRSGACALAASSTLAAGPALARALEPDARELRCAQERCFVGDEIQFGARIDGAERAMFRILGRRGVVAELEQPVVRGHAELRWTVPLDAVPRRPGLHPLRLQVRPAGGTRWIDADQPLTVVINRFAFGL